MQKLSLLDFPGVVACTLFTPGCNFRCPWCHNASLVLPEQFPTEFPDPEEVLAFLKKRQGILDGVCITGGEPLLHAEIPDFIRRLKELGYRVKLDTNGSFPERLRALAEEKLVDYVAMDIKNGPSHYAETIGVPGYLTEAVEESKNFLLTETVEYEFRTTVVQGLHTEERLLEAAAPPERVRVICGDAEEASFPQPFDVVMVYNAFPHFPDPEKLIAALAAATKPGGRLSVAHSMSRERLDRHHSGAACAVSNGLMSEDMLAAIFAPWFDVDVKISDERMYQVSGVRKTGS